MSVFTLAISCLVMSDLSWFMDLTFRCLYHIVLYSIRLHFHHQIHPWLGVMFLLWPSHVILSGAISYYALLFPSSILDMFRPGGLLFWCHIFLPFHTVHGVLPARILEWFAISPPVDHIFLELSTMTYVSWVALYTMAHTFIELLKPLHHDKAVIHEGWDV